jgi:hypothetical protein
MMRFFLSILGCLLLAGNALAAQVIVIAADKTDLAPGTTLDAGKPISLPAGASVTLITEAGKTITLKGPYSGVPETGTAGGDPQIVASLSKLFTGDARNRSLMGAFRKGGEAEDPWALRVGRSETTCVKVTGASLRRSSANRKAEAELRTEDGSANGLVVWEKGSKAAPWPSAVPLIDGGRYTITWLRRDFTFDLIVASAAFPTPAHAAAWLVEKGCERQARAVLANLE